MGILEDDVRLEAIIQDILLRHGSDDVVHPGSLTSLLKGQAFRNDAINKGESFLILHDGVVLADDTEHVVGTFLLGSELTGDAVTVAEVDGSLNHFVVQAGDLHRFLHGIGLADVGANLVPSSLTSNSSSHFNFLLEF